MNIAILAALLVSTMVAPDEAKTTCSEKVILAEKYQSQIERVKSAATIVKWDWAANTERPSWHDVVSFENLRAAVQDLMEAAKADGDLDDLKDFLSENPNYLPSTPAANIDQLALQTAPTAYELKAFIAREVQAINALLPEKLRIYFPAPRREENYREKLIEKAENLVSTNRARFTNLIPTTGKADFKTWIDAIRTKGNEHSKSALEAIEKDAVDFVILRPSSGRWWIPKVGFHNQFITGSSRGTFNNERRNRVESDYLGLPLSDYQAFSAELKPKYATLRREAELGSAMPPSYASHYGQDLYILKKNRLKNRTTFTIGDSLNRHYDLGKESQPDTGKQIPKPEAWDQVFIPYEYAALLASYFDGSENFAIKRYEERKWNAKWSPGSEYPELQIFGPLDLDDVERFEFTSEEPTGKFLDELKKRNIEIWDIRDSSQPKLFWSPIENWLKDLNAWDDESDRSTEAAHALLKSTNKPTDSQMAEIEKFAFGPPRQAAPYSVRFQEPAPPEKIPLLRRLELERCRMLFWEKLAEWRGVDYVADQLTESILSEKFPGFTSDEAILLLEKEGQLTEARLRKILEKKDWQDPHALVDGDLWNTKWDYEASLLAVAARRLDKHEAPIWEWVPVYGLFSANRAAREFSINILQTYMQLVHADAGLIHVSDPHLINFNKRGLETKSAAQYLNDHFSKLRGFARETALEVLRNTDDAEMPLLNGRDERKLTPNEVWRELVRDIAYEAEEFQVNSDQKLILSHIKDSSVSDTELESLGWGPTRLTSSPITKKHNISKLDPNPWAEKFYTASDHSMPDLETYLARRLGESTFELVRYRNVEPIVFAGSFKALLESGLVNISNLRRVPSPFSTWGIEKFLDSTDESNPRLIFRLPPNLQLARHYEAMLYRAHDLDAMVLDVKGHSELDRGLWLDGDDPIRVYLVESDRKKYEQEFHSLAKKLTQALGNNATVDHIVMGYEYAWRDAIAKDPHWTLSSEETVEANSDTTHLRLRLFKLTSKDDPSITESVLVAGSDKTLWGEGSLYLLQGLIESLPKSPKSVIFLGSAGSPGTNVQYGISFPGYFAGRDKQLIGAYTRNFLVPNSFSTHIWGRSEDGEEFSPSLGDMVNPSGRSSYFAVPKDAPLITLEHGVHGISYSPAEQSREFVEYALTAEFYYQPRVHTVDVETNLIASWLFDYNGNHPNSKIQFGIGHLITDNPASHSRTRETLHSLTEVDRDKKRLAREKLLAETLSRLLDAAKRLRRLAEQPNPAAHE